MSSESGHRRITVEPMSKRLRINIQGSSTSNTPPERVVHAIPVKRKFPPRHSPWNRNNVPLNHAEVENLLQPLDKDDYFARLNVLCAPDHAYRRLLKNPPKCLNARQILQVATFAHSITANYSDSPELTVQFVSDLASSRFMKTCVFPVITQGCSSALQTDISLGVELLGHVLCLLEACCQHVPVIARENLYELMLSLDTQVRDLDLLNSNSITEGIRQSVEQLSEWHKTSALLLSANAHLPPHERRILAMNASLPPEDFRRLSIVPTQDDVRCRSQPFLRRNIVDGRYDSVETYLDIHFRLLREDFVCPLRQGIQQLLETERSTYEMRKKCDMKVYRDVQILSGFPCSDSGLVHDLQFNVKYFRRINWMQTKRLIFCSLLCLSADQFETVYFATVASRCPKDLSKGLVTVKFADGKRPSRLDTYVMAEASVFFEAYRHTLSRLKELNEKNFPLQEILLGHFLPADKESAQPQQLTLPLPEYQKKHENFFLNLDCVVPGNDSATTNEQSICVFPQQGFSMHWPSSEELQLDSSQYAAFKYALTSQVSIIQGPPGCGKTYLGLKLMRVLLDACQRLLMGPILVVCYTNHALDQFLEGMLPFCNEGLVRVGGRSKCEALEKFNVRNLRHRGTFPAEYRKIHSLKKDFLKLQAKLKMATEMILPLEEILDFVPPHLYVSLPNILSDWFLGDGDIHTFLNTNQGQCASDVVEVLLIEVMMSKAEAMLEEYENDEPEEEQQQHQQLEDEEVMENILDEESQISSMRQQLHKDAMTEYEHTWDTFEIESKWCNIKSRQSVSSLIAARLRNNPPSSPPSDIMNLSQDARWSLYHSWQKAFVKNIIDRLNKLEHEYMTKCLLVVKKFDRRLT